MCQKHFSVFHTCILNSLSEDVRADGNFIDQLFGQDHININK